MAHRKNVEDIRTDIPTGKSVGDQKYFINIQTLKPKTFLYFSAYIYRGNSFKEIPLVVWRTLIYVKSAFVFNSSALIVDRHNDR